MTLIIGKEESGHLVMGADSASGTPEEFYVYPKWAKIAHCGPYLVGACGSGQVIQILHHCVEWPTPPTSEDDLCPFLIREVVPEVRRVAQATGLQPSRGMYLGDTTVVLIGIHGKLYLMGSDLVVVRSRGLSCIGCGRHAAYPVMEALERAGIGPVRAQIEMAMEIVSRHVPVVASPFRFLEQSSDQVLAPSPRSGQPAFAPEPLSGYG